MAFEYPKSDVFEGQITSVFAYTTATGKIYAYRFQHVADGVIHELMLHTRNPYIMAEYIDQMFRQFSTIQLWPHTVRVRIASEGLAFEVIEIDILE